jgi:hypothetical protein
MKNKEAEDRGTSASRSRAFKLLTETKRAEARQGDRNGRLGNHDDGSRKLRPGAAVQQAGRWGTDPAKACSALQPINNTRSLTLHHTNCRASC